MSRFPLLVAASVAGVSDASQVLLVGLYQSSGKSVNAYKFEGTTSLVPLPSSDIGDGPSWITAAGKHFPPNSNAASSKSLFTVSETGNTVASVSLDCKGKLEVTSRQSSGAGPVFLAIDHNSEHVLSGNYGAGSVSVFPQSWDKENQHATLNAASQTLEFGANAHAHSAYFAPIWAGDYVTVFVPTLGLDQVQQLNFMDGKLTKAHEPLSVPAQQGPRHMAFHPKLPIAVLANEGSATANVTIELLKYDENYGLSTVAKYDAGGPYGAPDLYPAEILFTKTGDFVLVSLRDATEKKRDGVAVFKVGEEGESLSMVDYAPVGHYPRSMALADNGLLIVGNQKGNSLSFLKFDDSTGKLTKAKEDMDVGDSPAFVGIFDLPEGCGADDVVVV